MDKNGEEDFLGRLSQLKKRQNELMRMYLVVLSMLLVSYVFGLLGFSLAWVVIIAFITFLVWKKRVIRMNEEFLREQEFYIHRKRTLKQNETCEWLNLIVNRWFVFTSKSFSEIFKTKIDAIMDVLKPDILNSLNFKSFNVQTGTPQMKEIHSFEIIHGNNKSSTVQSPSFLTSLSQSQKYQLVVEASVEMHSEHLMTIEAVLSGKWSGLSMDVSIENFSMVGKVQVHINMDKDTPFPHISSLSFSFPQKPDVHFGVRVLRHVQLMEIPFLKMWLHSMVSNTLLEAFVDPGKLEFSLKNFEGMAGRPCLQPAPLDFAVGVLTVNMTGSIKTSKDKNTSNPFELMNEQKYFEISLGKQKHSSHPSSSSALPSSSSSSVPSHSPSSFSSSSSPSETHFNYVVSLFVYDLTREKLKMNLMSQMFLSRLSLAGFQIPLSSLQLPTTLKGEMRVNKELERTNESFLMHVLLDYTPVDNVQQAIQNAPEPDPMNMIKSGVVSVCMHGASDLLGLDADGMSDPYCLLYSSGKKISTTHYAARTKNPNWDAYSQFIVEDLSKVVLSFVVYDWDGVSMSEDDFLGSAHISMAQTEYPIIHQCFPLLPTYLDTQSADSDVTNRGLLFISVIFTPVSHVPSQTVEHALEQKRYFSQASRVANVTEGQVTDMCTKGIIQVHVIQAKDLTAKDRNGLSDPFFEILIGGDKKCTSEVIRKNLNPVWDQEFDLEMPGNEETMEIVVWDHDRVMKNDFIGSVSMSRSQLIHLASDFKFDGWLKLEKVEQGWLQVKVKVFVQDECLGGEMDACGDGIDPSDRIGKNNNELNRKQSNTNNNNKNNNNKNNNELNEGSKDSRERISNSSLIPPNSNSSRTHSSIQPPSSHPSFANSKDLSVSSMNESVISLKIQEFNKEFKSVSTLTLHPVYEGIVIEVWRVEGLVSSLKPVCCRVKLTGAVNGRKTRTLLSSPPFLPDKCVDVSFRFQVDNNSGGGVKKDSSLSFKFKSGRFNVMCKMVVVLMDILPVEAKQTRNTVLCHEDIKLHVSCTYQSVHMTS